MQAMKTGALFRYACEAGAILGRASADDRRHLAAGATLGLAFKIADDLIDAPAHRRGRRGDLQNAGRGKQLVGSTGSIRPPGW